MIILRESTIRSLVREMLIKDFQEKSNSAMLNEWTWLRKLLTYGTDDASDAFRAAGKMNKMGGGARLAGGTVLNIAELVQQPVWNVIYRFLFNADGTIKPWGWKVFNRQLRSIENATGLAKEGAKWSDYLGGNWDAPKYYLERAIRGGDTADAGTILDISNIKWPDEIQNMIDEGTLRVNTIKINPSNIDLEKVEYGLQETASEILSKRRADAAVNLDGTPKKNPKIPTEIDVPVFSVLEKAGESVSGRNVPTGILKGSNVTIENVDSIVIGKSGDDLLTFGELRKLSPKARAAIFTIRALFAGGGWAGLNNWLTGSYTFWGALIDLVLSDVYYHNLFSNKIANQIASTSRKIISNSDDIFNEKGLSDFAIGGKHWWFDLATESVLGDEKFSELVAAMEVFGVWAHSLIPLVQGWLSGRDPEEKYTLEYLSRNAQEVIKEKPSVESAINTMDKFVREGATLADFSAAWDVASKRKDLQPQTLDSIGRVFDDDINSSPSILGIVPLLYNWAVDSDWGLLKRWYNEKYGELPDSELNIQESDEPGQSSVPAELGESNPEDVQDVDIDNFQEAGTAYVDLQLLAEQFIENVKNANMPTLVIWNNLQSLDPKATVLSFKVDEDTTMKEFLSWANTNNLFDAETIKKLNAFADEGLAELNSVTAGGVNVRIVDTIDEPGEDITFETEDFKDGALVVHDLATINKAIDDMELSESALEEEDKYRNTLKEWIKSAKNKNWAGRLTSAEEDSRMRDILTLDKFFSITEFMKNPKIVMKSPSGWDYYRFVAKLIALTGEPISAKGYNATIEDIGRWILSNRSDITSY